MFKNIIKVFTITFGVIGVAACIPLILLALLMSYVIRGVAALFTFFLFHAMTHSAESQEKLMMLYDEFRGK